MNAAPIPWVVDLECTCHIFLPPEIQKQTLLSGERQTTDRPSSSFLCLRHKRVSEVPLDKFHPGAWANRVGQYSLVWRVAYGCAHEDCGRRGDMLVPFQPDADSVKSRILNTMPEIPCGGHYVVWDEDLIDVLPIAHDPPVR